MTAGILLRPATAEDLPRVAEIHVAAWRAAYRGIIADRILDALRPEERRGHWEQWRTGPGVELQLAVQGDGILGFARLCPARPLDAPPAGFSEVTHLYLDPGRRGQGIGELLLQWALDRSRLRGDRGLLLWVLEENAPARRFYQRMGLAPDGARHDEPGWLGEGVFECRYRMRFDREAPPA